MSRTAVNNRGQAPQARCRSREGCCGWLSDKAPFLPPTTRKTRRLVVGCGRALHSVVATHRNANGLCRVLPTDVRDESCGRVLHEKRDGDLGCFRHGREHRCVWHVVDRVAVQQRQPAKRHRAGMSRMWSMLASSPNERAWTVPQARHTVPGRLASPTGCGVYVCVVVHRERAQKARERARASERERERERERRRETVRARVCVCVLTSATHAASNTEHKRRAPYLDPRGRPAPAATPPGTTSATRVLPSDISAS